MPNIPPLISAMPDSQSLYAPYTTSSAPVFPVGFGTVGVINNIVWGSAGGSYVLGVIPLAGLTETSIVMVTIQAQDASELAPGYVAIVEATPASTGGGTIRVVLNHIPLSTINLYLAWQVLQF